MPLQTIYAAEGLYFDCSYNHIPGSRITGIFVEGRARHLMHLEADASPYVYV